MPQKKSSNLTTPATSRNRWSLLTKVDQIAEYIPGISPERLQEAKVAAAEHRFRIPAFYVENVLTEGPEDPLLDIVLPSIEELDDGEERWDATSSPYSASDSPFWIQKYEFQGLIRLTTFCSGLCRFCYLKKKNAKPRVITPADIDQLFDDLEQRGHRLREVILSGGDPLSAPPEALALIGKRMEELRERYGEAAPHLTVHTREPVWDPVRLMENPALWRSLKVLRAKTYMINVLHPREVTPEFKTVCKMLAEANSQHMPALFSQHPLFRGVNDSVEVLEELYVKLFSCSPPVIPYYLVHPFYNGTLPKHTLSIEKSQAIHRALLRRPGVLVPRLVVPTPWGKCVIGPNDPLPRSAAGYELITKDGQSVTLG